MLTRRNGAWRRIRPGPTTVATIKPIPSMAREASSVSAPIDRAPSTEPMLRKTKPNSSVRRSPMFSANKDTARPPSMPATCTMPSNTPAVSRDNPRSSWIKGRAAGNFQICRAAVMPATTTTIQAASPLEARGRLGRVMVNVEGPSMGNRRNPFMTVSWNTKICRCGRDAVEACCVVQTCRVPSRPQAPCGVE